MQMEFSAGESNKIMKNKLLGWLRAIRDFFLKRLHCVGRIFYAQTQMRPGFRRGLFALGLYAAIAVPAAIVGAQVLACVWAAGLFMLFLGMGAERASLDWDPVLALPPVRSFAFWRWHALERKRFLAVLVALSFGLILSLAEGAV